MRKEIKHFKFSLFPAIHFLENFSSQIDSLRSLEDNNLENHLKLIIKYGFDILPINYPLHGYISLFDKWRVKKWAKAFLK